MTFWADGMIHPKTKNRFLVTLDGQILWSIKTCTKPSVTVDVKEFRMINHYYKYPGLVKWGPITMTFVDPYGQHPEDLAPKPTVVGELGGFVNRLDIPAGAAGGFQPKADRHGWTDKFFRSLLSKGGYKTPNKGGLTALEKASMLDNAFENNSLVIQQIGFGLNGGTPNVTESWKIVNPIIKSIDWGSLDYNDISPIEYKLEIEYDYALSSHDITNKQKAFTSTSRAAGMPTATDMPGFEATDLATAARSAVGNSFTPTFGGGSFGSMVGGELYPQSEDIFDSIDNSGIDDPNIT